MSTSSEEEAVVTRSRKQDTSSESSEEEQKLVEEGETLQVYAASDDSDNGEFTEISEIAVVTSFTQQRQEARFRALNRMYIEAKVVFIEEQTLHSGKKVVQLHCWGGAEQSKHCHVRRNPRIHAGEIRRARNGYSGKEKHLLQ